MQSRSESDSDSDEDDDDDGGKEEERKKNHVRLINWPWRTDFQCLPTTHFFVLQHFEHTTNENRWQQESALSYLLDVSGRIFFRISFGRNSATAITRWSGSHPSFSLCVMIFFLEIKCVFVCVVCQGQNKRFIKERCKFLEERWPDVCVCVCPSVSRDDLFQK